MPVLRGKEPPTPHDILAGMKTAVTLPDDVFDKAERLATLRNVGRDELYAEALRHYIARHDPDAVTDAMNRVIDEIGDETDPFVQAAARRTLKQVEW